jgi:transposase
MGRKKVVRESVVLPVSDGGVQRQRFNKEFKLAAVGLMRQGEKPTAQIAAELGVRRNQLYKWQEQLEAKAGDTQAAFNGPGRKPMAQLSEIERLRRELARVTEERDILKKAAAYFAREIP